MKPEREPYFRIVAGILAVAAIPLLGILLFDGTAWLAILKDWQSGVGAFWGALFGLGAILIGALVNADLNRNRDERLREQESRALADALLGELIAALVSCRAFISVGRSAEGKKYQKAWLDEKINATDLAPRITTIVFEGNVAKLGLFGSPLVRDVVVIYESLRNYDRLARVEQIISRGEAIRIRLERAAHLEKYDTNDVAELIEILDAYAMGGYEAALPVGLRVTTAREKRRAELGKELGIPSDSTETNETTS